MTKSYWRFFFGVLIIGVCLLVGGSKVFQDFFFAMIFGEAREIIRFFKLPPTTKGKLF